MVETLYYHGKIESLNPRMSLIGAIWMLTVGILLRKSMAQSPKFRSPGQFRPWSSRYSDVQSPASTIENFKWCDLQVDPAELRPDFTLMMGQCFNWRPLNTPKFQDTAGPGKSRDSDHICWVGVLGGRALAVRQTPISTQYALLGDSSSSGTTNDDRDIGCSVLSPYFQLDSSLIKLYTQWGAESPRMKQILDALPGVRVVRQDPYECLISFICSSNNNIKRITGMLDSLRRRYGVYIGSLSVCPTTDQWIFQRDSEMETAARQRTLEDERTAQGMYDFFAFPEPHVLAAAPLHDLRALGLGYRDKFVKAASGRVCSLGGRPWLAALRGDPDRAAVQRALVLLEGVGPKVADCVALFSLDQADCIPVDTHVWDICVRDFNPSLAAAKSLTTTVYEAVGNEFRLRYGDRAGWAHSVLFAGELPEFRDRLPDDVVREMEQFVETKKRERAEAKLAKKEKKSESQSGTPVTAGGGSSATSPSISTKTAVDSDTVIRAIEGEHGQIDTEASVVIKQEATTTDATNKQSQSHTKREDMSGAGGVAGPPPASSSSSASSKRKSAQGPAKGGHKAVKSTPRRVGDFTLG